MTPQLQAALFYARERRKSRPIGMNRAPTSTDDVTKGFAVGMRWYNGANGSTYQAASVTAGAAVWNIV